jgi:hypothetical protein
MWTVSNMLLLRKALIFCVIESSLGTKRTVDCIASKMMKVLFRFSRRSAAVLRTTTQRRPFSQTPEPPKSNLRGPVTFGGLAILAVGGVAAWFWHYVEKEEKIKEVASKVSTTGKPALGGPWVLVDQDGVPRSDASYHGKFSLLYFGFTHCPDICPSELVKIGKIMNELGKTYDFSLLWMISAFIS